MTNRVQKMARINVDPMAWSALRVAALESNEALADMLGRLVEQAAERVGRQRERQAPKPPAPQQPVVAATPAEVETDADGDWTAYRADRAEGDTWIPPWEE